MKNFKQEDTIDAFFRHLLTLDGRPSFISVRDGRRLAYRLVGLKPDSATPTGIADAAHSAGEMSEPGQEWRLLSVQLYPTVLLIVQPWGRASLDTSRGDDAVESASEFTNRIGETQQRHAQCRGSGRAVQ